MWLFTKVGFFSAVQGKKDGKADPHVVVIRSRISGDLEALKKAYMYKLGPTLQSEGTDYPYRAVISKKEYAKGLERMGRDVDYDNFKSMITRVQGLPREQLYARVWSIMANAERELRENKKYGKGKQLYLDGHDDWLNYRDSYPNTTSYGKGYATSRTYTGTGSGNYTGTGYGRSYSQAASVYEKDPRCGWCDGVRPQRGRWGEFCSRKCKDDSEVYYQQKFASESDAQHPEYTKEELASRAASPSTALVPARAGGPLLL